MMNLKSTALQEKGKENKPSHGRTVRAAMLVAAAILCMACIWPAGVITLKKESRSRATQHILSEAVRDDAVYGQAFVPSFAYLEGIMIKIARGAASSPEEEGSLTLTLYNIDGEIVAAATEPVAAFEEKMYHMLPLGVKVEKGSQYYYTIEVSGCQNAGIQVLFADTGKVELAENLFLHYKGQTFPMYSTMAVYCYRTALGIENILMYDAWIAMMALFLWFGTGRDMWKQKEQSK